MRTLFSVCFNSFPEYAMVVRSMVTASKEPIYSSLISPMLDNRNEDHCLSFELLTMNAFEVNLLYGDGHRKQIWRIRDSMYNQFCVNRLIVLPLPIGMYKIEFKATFLPMGAVISLDTILVKPGDCLKPGKPAFQL